MVASFGVGLDVSPHDRLLAKAFGEPCDIPVASLHCPAVQALNAEVSIASNMFPFVRRGWEHGSGGGECVGIRDTDWW